MKKPTKPSKPATPTPPQEFFDSFEADERVVISHDDEVKLDPKKTWYFTTDSFRGCYGKGTEYLFYTRRPIKTRNPWYASQLASYNARMKHFPKRMDKYKKKLAEWGARMEEWEIWKAKQEVAAKAKEEESERKLLDKLKQKYEHI